MNINTSLFLLILSPILWILAASSFLYVNILNIKNAKFDVQVISAYNCEYESDMLQRKFANSLNIPLNRFSSRCNHPSDLNTNYNVSIILKTYNYRLLQIEQNLTHVQNILDNVYVACTYNRDDITRHVISTAF